MSLGPQRKTYSQFLAFSAAPRDQAAGQSGGGGGGGGGGGQEDGQAGQHVSEAEAGGRGGGRQESGAFEGRRKEEIIVSRYLLKKTPFLKYSTDC